MNNLRLLKYVLFLGTVVSSLFLWIRPVDASWNYSGYVYVCPNGSCSARRPASNVRVYLTNDGCGVKNGPSVLTNSVGYYTGLGGSEFNCGGPAYCPSLSHEFFVDTAQPPPGYRGGGQWQLLGNTDNCLPGSGHAACCVAKEGKTIDTNGDGIPDACAGEQELIIGADFQYIEPYSTPTPPPSPLACVRLTNPVSQVNLGGFTRVFCYASRAANHFNFRFNVNGGPWNNQLTYCIPGDTQCALSVTASQTGQYTVECQVCDTALQTNCTPWGVSQTSPTGCQVIFTVPTPTPTPPSITPTKTRTPTPPITKTRTPTPPIVAGCTNYGVDEHSTGNYSNIIKIVLNPSKNISLLRKVTCKADGVCDGEGMDNRGSTVYLVANKTSPKIYTVNKSNGALTSVTSLNRAYEGISFRPGDPSNIVWGGSRSSMSNPNGSIYSINLSGGSSTCMGGACKGNNGIWIKSITWNNAGTALYVSNRTNLFKFNYNSATRTLTRDTSYNKRLPGNTDAMDMTSDGYLVGGYKSSGDLIIYFFDVTSGVQVGSFYKTSLSSFNTAAASFAAASGVSASGTSFTNLDAFTWLCGNRPK